MKEKLIELVTLALQYQTTDLHFVLQHQCVQVSMRSIDGMKELHSALIDRALFNYLKYIANIDLGNATKPQSGQFQLMVHGKRLFFRFSLISTMDLETGVLRILNNHEKIDLNKLTMDSKQYEIFQQWTKRQSGMVILSGPTGSGKTTTLHAILSEIAMRKKRKIITLEDPIEIKDERYLQLAVNEATGFTYEEGIRQLMRHDPDVIMLGEIRDSYTAKMAYRCALTGHMVFSTVHASNAQEAIKRLCELGLRKEELQETLVAMSAQRLFPSKQKKGERICLYEILQENELRSCLQGKRIIHQDIDTQIQQAIAKGYIEAET